MVFYNLREEQKRNLNKDNKCYFQIHRKIKKSKNKNKIH